MQSNDDIDSPSKDHRATRYSLLARALDGSNERAWEELYEQYQSYIYYLLRKFSTQESDLDDLAQDVMVTLMKNLKTYDKDKGKFRTWFSVMVRNIYFAHIRKLSRKDAVLQQYKEQPIDSYSPDELTGIIKEEWEQFILDSAYRRIEDTFRGKAIDVFKLTLQGMPLKEIASRLDLSESSVYNLKYRVRKSLITEISDIQASLEIWETIRTTFSRV